MIEDKGLCGEWGEDGWVTHGLVLGVFLGLEVLDDVVGMFVIDFRGEVCKVGFGNEVKRIEELLGRVIVDEIIFLEKEWVIGIVFGQGREMLRFLCKEEF